MMTSVEEQLTGQFMQQNMANAGSPLERLATKETEIKDNYFPWKTLYR